MLSLIGATWLGLFAGLYFGFYARQTTTIDMIYWSSAFAPLPPRTLGELTWYPRSIANVLGWLLSFPGTLISGLALLAGGFAIARSRPWLFAVLAGPIVSAVAVSAARAYPFETRLNPVSCSAVSDPARGRHYVHRPSVPCVLGGHGLGLSGSWSERASADGPLNPEQPAMADAQS